MMKLCLAMGAVFLLMCGIALSIASVQGEQEARQQVEIHGDIYVRVKSTNDLVYVIGRNQTVGSLNHPVWVCRIDHGPGTMPRYEEHNFSDAELERVK